MNAKISRLSIEYMFKLVAVLNMCESVGLRLCVFLEGGVCVT